MQPTPWAGIAAYSYSVTRTDGGAINCIQADKISRTRPHF